MSADNKVFVIGSNSFSGACYVRNLLNKGYRVYGLSRSEEYKDYFLQYRYRETKVNNFSFHQLDLNKDLNQIMALINKEAPAYVVNFAAQGMVAQSWETPQDWFRTNTLSNIMFHDQLRKCSFLKKYVHISTPEVYGSCENSIIEHRNYNPSTPYATSRAAADMSLKNFFDNYDFPVVWTRAANVYGACQQLYRIIPRVVISVLTQRKIPLHGGGKSVRSFIHMDDVSQATMNIMEAGTNGEIYHISTDQLISIYDLVQMICKKMNVSFDDHVDVAPERAGKDSAYILDSTKLKNQFNWEAKITLDDGIQEVITWAQDNLSTLKDLNFNYVHKP
jgi:dTDP-glucose 4,6-dehydratase